MASNILIEDWGFDPALLDYVKSNFTGGFRVTAVADENPLRLSFKERAANKFDDLGDSYRDITTFLSVQRPEKGDGYGEGYPHAHNPVIIHYLDPSDDPTPLHVFEKENGKLIDEIIPKSGMAVYVPGWVWHGVPKHKGTTPRIQIIAMVK